MIDRLKAVALAVLTVIAVYFLATVFGKIGGNAQYFLPLDILVYLGIGFFSARTLGDWRGASVVVLIAAIVDAALAVGSLILPNAPKMSPAKILEAEALEIGFNVLLGLVGVASARIRSRRMPPLGAFVLFALMTAASAGAAPTFSIAPTGVAAKAPLKGRMLVFIQLVTDTKVPVPKTLDPGFVAGGFQLVGFDVASPAGATIFVPANAATFPKSLAALPSGTYDVQALLDVRRMYTYDEIGQGDLTGPVRRVHIGRGSAVELELSTVVPAEALVQTATVRFFTVRSALLSTFYHHPVDLRASVVLPLGYDPSKRYPVVYWQNGFGGTWTGGFNFDRMRGMMSADGLHAIIVVTDSSAPSGITQFADSATNGPWGAAFVREFVPAIERAFPIDGTPPHRLLWGHSSGGWASLWLQVAYPKFFGGTWSSAPDPVDFHDFTGPDLLATPADNAYVDPYGHPWQLVRSGGKDVMSFRDFVLSSDVMGYRSSQFGSFDAVFSPAGLDGAPVPLFDHKTGRVNPDVVAYWETHYDIANKIEREWPIYGTALTDRIHVAVGTLDTFHLERGVLRLDARMRQLGVTPNITYIQDASHFSLFQKSTNYAGFHWAFKGMAAALATPPPK
ncbi:MAG: esterase family protein [Candidatus Eremiobacteraeota bacterium]|nr:esterase family protein [Candidatus Eremiobacteraeota bacterium]